MDTKITMLETVIHEGQRFEADETRMVTSATATYFCQHGWAEDPSGVIESGERKEGHVKAEVAKVSNRGRRNR